MLVLALSANIRVFCVVYTLSSQCCYLLLFLELDKTTALQLSTAGC